MGLTGRYEKHVRLAQEEALLAGGDDLRMLPEVIFEAARELYAPVAAVRDLSKVSALDAAFGPGVGHALRYELGFTQQPLAPDSTRLAADRTPRLAIVDLEPTTTPARAVVHVSARIKVWRGPFGFVLAYALSSARTRRATAFWVLESEGHGEPWKRIRVESAGAGKHYIDGDPTNHGSKLAGLRDSSVLEVAEVPARAPRLDRQVIANLPSEPAAKLIELAHFDPALERPVIEASIRSILKAWAGASDDDPNNLRDLADDLARYTLLGDGRHALRRPLLTGLEILTVHAWRDPVELTMAVDIKAWIGAREPRYVDQEPGRRRTRTVWWRIARTDSANHPWRLVDAAVDPFDPYRSR